MGWWEKSQRQDLGGRRVGNGAETTRDEEEGLGQKGTEAV